MIACIIYHSLIYVLYMCMIKNRMNKAIWKTFRVKNKNHPLCITTGVLHIKYISVIQMRALMILYIQIFWCDCLDLNNIPRNTINFHNKIYMQLIAAI